MKAQILKFSSTLTAAMILFGASTFAKNFETSEYGAVLQEVEAQTAKYGRDQVLVVFDVDNTLVANPSDLGTDQWFEWQRELIKASEFKFAVARDFNGLIRAQNLLYSVGHMRETQEEVSDTVGTLQKAGIATMVLTARNLDSRDATLRELDRNGLNFSKTAVGGRGYAGSFIPYDLKHPLNDGLTSRELSQWGLAEARPVSYMDGVFMVGGQHKGAMLRVLLSKTHRSFSAIVFIDDKVKNNTSMQQGFEGQPVELTTIRYTREDGNVARFNQGSKAVVVEQWEKLSETIEAVFGR